MIETTRDGPGSRFHTTTLGGYSVIRDHMGGIGRRFEHPEIVLTPPSLTPVTFVLL